MSMRRATINGSCLALCLASVLPARARSETFAVPLEFPTIQSAVDAAAAGDTVTILAGVYPEHEILLLRDIVVLGAGMDPSGTTIDAEGLGRGIVVDMNVTCRIEGLRIVGGNAQPRGGWAGNGGGIHSYGRLVLEHVWIESCTAQDRGGGLFAGGNYFVPVIELRDLVVVGNTSENGGGVYLEVAPIVLADSRIEGNVATSRGGGIYINNAPATLSGLQILDNEAPNGGGLYLTTVFASGGASLSESTISGCVAMWGGGVLNLGPNLFRNCTIARCKGYLGGGIFNIAYYDYPGSALLEQCIIAFNEGAGVYPELVLRDGILPELSCCDVYGNTGGNYGNGMSDQTGENGNISKDPGFCEDAEPDTYPLRKDSPCAPANNTCGLLMGAFPVGCDGTATEETSWSRIKSLY